MIKPRTFVLQTVLIVSLAMRAMVSFSADDTGLNGTEESLKAYKDRVAFFEQNVRPILIEHCYECHSAKSEKLRGNLHLDSKSGWQRGGDSGQPAIVPGNAEESMLLRTVQHLEDGMEMPPNKPKLPPNTIADLTTWIQEGAVDPREEVAVATKRGDKNWWSLQPLKTSGANPSIQPNEVVLEDGKEGALNSIDAFIDAKLQERNLSRNPPADPRALIRRMTYDVIGLPPNHEEADTFIRSFESDPDLAVQTLVDRLLASPRYGERWGRHWLDVVRFGESNGFERNVVINNLWPFRDYVIQSFNHDKPFNRFILEHLAGDVIGKDDPNVEIGSAFLVAGPYDDVGNQDVVAQKNIRAATLDDIITATSGAFLGLTINCARCHHHKFDPIPTEDYYRMRAAFEGVNHGARTIASKADRQSFDAASQALNEAKNKLTTERELLHKIIEDRAKVEFDKTVFQRPKIDVHGTTESFFPIEARFVRFVIHAVTSSVGSSQQVSSQGGKLTEFEVWNTEGVNVALASRGGIAEGKRSAVADDFPEAYGPQLCIDGLSGEQWFIGNPAELKITLPKPEVIDRIHFANSKGRDFDESKVRGATPCEYEVQTSLDGIDWKTVANSDGREPWTPAHGIARIRRSVMTTEDQHRLSQLDRDIASIQNELKKLPVLPELWAGNFTQPKEATFVHVGGDPMKPGESVLPSSLNVLDKVVDPYELPENVDESARRLSLAKWIVDDKNPLTSRVLANRIWQYHFGTGIVDTPSDFGFLGSQPTHPELLDYLASQLIRYNWQLKPLHREILLSKTYLQSSQYQEVGASLDKETRLLWRFPPRRLSAEEIRDSMLLVADKLKLEPMGGPGFRLYQFTQNNVCTYFPLDVHGPETYRRSVYHQNARASIVDILSDFDLPDNAFAAPKRANTTSPLQSLTLLNHQFTLDMARALAQRANTIPLARKPVESSSEKAEDKVAEESIVDTIYSIALQRPPTVQESKNASSFISQYGIEAFCRVLLNSNEFIYLD